ncbi:hypothetical protein XBP1_470014 [Xenorhabdus bovienii str. puntauvense]|uniref:Uncharacterized protein n=2 Tax=Xenorhabdus bovienii TaxID=40576 RepID=A0A0B6X2A0_XENBV|nr:hypothetical protein XBP1_470014 [Xenorhabdus bovienii str. puntauvense]CDM87867.1 protein of unknown function [Xenorhabdus bovienii]
MKLFNDVIILFSIYKICFGYWFRTNKMMVFYSIAFTSVIKKGEFVNSPIFYGSQKRDLSSS